MCIYSNVCECQCIHTAHVCKCMNTSIRNIYLYLHICQISVGNLLCMCCNEYRHSHEI